MEPRRGLILFIRFVLIVILLSLIALTARATAQEVKPPQMILCGASNGTVTIQRVCIKIQLLQKTFVLMFSPDGTTVIAIIRINKDGTHTLVYQVPPTLDT